MTPYERLTKLLELAESDPDCAACAEDVSCAQALLDDFLKDKAPEDSPICSALPVTLRIYYGRVLELVCREMRFHDEDL